MNALVSKYFQEDVNFEEVQFLTEAPLKQWNEIERLVPDFSRAWFELSRIGSEDRVDFTRDYWLQALPYRPSIQKGLFDFFASLDDVVVVLSRNKELWTAQLVYSLADNSCFFRGLSPGTDSALAELQEEVDFAFPQDWRTFMKIHNGFGKLSELGLLQIEEIAPTKRHIIEMIMHSQRDVKSGNALVDIHSLVPFYEAFGLNSFQCFFADWYPDNEMGNVYFSGIDYTLSDTSRPSEGNENGAFPSFSAWLLSYLEGMNFVP